MDIKNLRDMMREWYQSSHDPRAMSADEDFDEAARAIRALKSLFEQELRHRQAVADARTSAVQTGKNDGTE